MIKINFRYVRTRTAAPGADTYHTTKTTVPLTDLVPLTDPSMTHPMQDLVGGQGNKNMTDMKNIIKKMPKYKKEMANHATFFTLAEDCMNAYGKGTYHT